jgi:hypothetical protein
MAEYVTVAVTADTLFPDAPFLSDELAEDLVLQVTSVPADTLGGPFGVADMVNTLHQLASNEESLAAGEPITRWGPIESMLMWAAGYLVETGTDGNFARQFAQFGARNSQIIFPSENLGTIAQAEQRRLEAASGILPDLRRDAVLPAYAALTEVQLFAVRNSPLSIVSGKVAAGLNAATPGVAFIVTDGSVVAAIASSAAGLFITYIAIPSLRGIGTGLETVLHNWILQLGPKHENPPKGRKKKDG